MNVDVAVLGPLEVRRDGTDVLLDRAAWRRLLLLLAIGRGEVVPDERLVEALWPEGGGSLATLRTYVSHVRRRLGAEVVDRRGPGYRLAVGRDRLDAEVFERSLAQGRELTAAGDVTAAVSVLDRGLALWRGPALVEVADLPFGRGEAQRLDDLRLDAEEVRLAAALAVADGADHTAAARALTEAQPLRERRWELLLRALAAAGRQQEALVAYRHVRDRLVNDLGVEPGPALRDVHDRLLRHELPVTAAVAATPPSSEVRPAGEHAPRSRLRAAVAAASDRFIGREALLAQVTDHLARRRLVTLLGPGGSGKTRLAHELVRRRARAGEGGRDHVVDLTEVRDPDRVVDQVVAAIGVTRRPHETVLESLVGHLEGQPALLYVDNAEHLRDAVAALLEVLLAALPMLTVLVTSRSPLEVAGEQRVPVPPLTLPSDDTATDAEAVQLFVDRARAADPAFALGPTSTSAVVRICRRLDGMPLALELAAARIAHLDVNELADRLEERLDLLTRRRGADRHRSLRTTVDWSHYLLTVDERRLWRRLGVLAGAFGLDAVRAVATLAGGAAPAVPDPDLVLASLVDQSLVVAERDIQGRTRYRLLETLRADALGRLDAANETDGVLERLTFHLVEWAERFAPTMVWVADRGSIEAADAEHANLRTAVTWALRSGRADLVLRIGAGLVSVWHLGGRGDEPRVWLDAALATDVDMGDEVVLARALQAAAWLACAQSDYPRGIVLAERALALAERQGDDRRVAWALDTLGNAAWKTGRWDDALAHYRRSMPIWEALGDQVGIASLLQCVGAVAFRRGAYPQTAALLDRAEATYHAGGLEVPGWIHYDRGILADRLGRYDEARSHLGAALDATQRSGDPASIAASLRDLARVAVNEGRLDDATTWCRESLRLHRQVRDRWGEAATLAVAARAVLLAGDRVRALEDARASRDGFLDLGEEWGTASAEVVLGRALTGSDPEGARAVLDAAVGRASRLGDLWLRADALEGLIEVLPPAEARRVAAEADEVCGRIGAPVARSERTDHARRRASLR
jgi:predicted ATPase/DNA-binding SARP family transcriptional activator